MRLLYLLFLLPFILVAQPNGPTAKGWQELTISDGLSQGMIYDLKQDAKGFVWVATKDGLNRYDGHNFKVFTHDPYNPFTLSENVCTSLLIDRQHRIWIGTQNKGLNLLDPQTGRFYHLTISADARDNSSSYAITKLVEDPDGNIWISTENDRLVKVSLPAFLRRGFPDQSDFTRQVTLTPVVVRENDEKTFPSTIGFAGQQQLLAVTWKGFYTLNWQQPTRVKNWPLFDPNEVHHLMGAYTDSVQNYCFVLVRNRLFSWHQGKVRSAYLKTDGSIRVHVQALDPQRIVIATTDHLWIMSPEDLFRQDSLTGRNAYVALPPDLFGVSSLLEDRTGNIWIGTMGYGLRKYNPQVRLFHSYLPNRSLMHLAINQQGRTFVRMYDGFAELDRQQQLVPLTPPGTAVENRPEWFVLPDRQGFFWTFNTRRGVTSENALHELLKFSADWKLLRRYTLPPGCRLGVAGNQALEDKDGSIWIGAINGKLLRFDPKTEQFRVIDYSSVFPQIGAPIQVFALLPEPDNTLWIGTQQGLVRIRSFYDKPTFTLFRNLTQDKQSLSEDFVLSLCRDPNQPDRYLWVGTKGGGLDRLDKETGQFTHFTEAQGLPNKVVYGLLADNGGNLWMSTNRGIAQFNPKTGKFRTFTKADGLQDDEFNNQSYAKAPTGELLFGGINGLTTFRPSEIVNRSQKLPKVAIVGLKINNKGVETGGPEGVLTAGIEFTDGLDLRHDQNLLTLEFGVMDFTNPNRNQFRYRLEGIDRDWVEAGTNRFANYAQLPDGRYTLTVMGSVDGEHWSKPLDLQIRVRPPFYRTWWAYLFYVAVLGLLGWQFYRFQTQRLLLQQQIAFEHKETNRLAELDDLKTRFFTNISHEFRTPLTLILGPLNNRKRKALNEPELDMMERNSNRLMMLINQLLDLSKLEAGELRPEPKPGDLAAFFRTLAASFESLADSRAIRFRFSQNQDRYWATFDRDKLEKITTNLLSNAFKFTPDGNEVRMDVTYLSDDDTGARVRLVLADTGIGIAPDHLPRIFDRFYQRPADASTDRDGKSNRYYEGTGIGLALVQELVKILKGTVAVESTEGQTDGSGGTVFRVELPLSPAAAPAEPQTPWAVSRSVAAPREPSIPASVLVAAKTDETANILLIIDDNADIRAYVRSVFETDYQIIEAVDGQQGLEVATQATPNLVICDLMMPRLDGFGFCRALKTAEATSHIPVVMLTAKATLEDRIEGFGLGADDYLTKPFNADELRVRVRNLLDKQERLHQYFGKQPVSASIVSVTVDATPVLSREAIFLQKARQVVEARYADSTFGPDQLSQAMNLSPSQLLRKLKALTGLTAVEFLRQYRLERAAVLLAGRAGTVSEIAYQVGFESLSYFTRTFQEQYSVLPSEYTM